MSASRTKLLASKTKKKEESDVEEYDSEEERYRWKQQRLLKKVEESASAIRAVNEITRPFVTGTWRLEREEQRIAALAAAAAMASTPSKENKRRASTATATGSRAGESWNEKNDDGDKADPSRRKSIWSPIKHVKTTDVQAVLAMEKTPTWRPLRKSKARQSLAQSLALFNAENACESVDEDNTSGCKPLAVIDSVEKTPVKVAEEVRTPLRDVVGLNQAIGRRKSVSVSNDVTPAPSSAPVDSSDELTKLGEVVRESHPAESFTDSELSGGTPSRSSSLDETEVGIPVSQTRSFLKSCRSPVRCSPILLQAYGEEYAAVRGSIVSPEKVVNLNECDKDASKVLKGVTAYVEVRRGEDDRTGGFRWKLTQLGANISDTLNKKVTHVVFQEGLLSTFRKAKQIGAHLVSTHWVMACDESLSKIEEAKYPIEKLEKYEFADPLQKAIKRPKIMSPDLGSGRDDKLLNKRLQRRSMRVDSPLAKPSRNLANIMKTPSPLKRINLTTRASLSPKKLITEDATDDWDGFLAMVEAQVREKAESKRKTGEMNGTEEDFETRLQRLLGQDKDKGAAQPPVASIFQKGKVSTGVVTRSSPKKTKEVKKTKQNFDSTSRNSVMSWLQRRSPQKGSGGASSAAIAASAAADEILKSMFKAVEHKAKTAATGPKESDKSLQRSTKTSKTTANEPKPIDKPKEPFVFTGKSDKSKTVSTVTQPQKKPAKKNKFEFQGSTASSGAMRNWLSGAKSPTQPIQQTKQSLSSEVSHKRKASEETLVDSTSENTATGREATKKYCGEVTPVKRVPTKDSAINSDKKKSVELTPRRRSMRLTPIKSTSLQSNITQLETLQESEVSTFDQSTTTTPRKLSTKSSSRITPNKLSHSSVSKRTATPSKK